MSNTFPIDGEAAVYVAAENFVPGRLTLAREAAGLLQQELAERIDTTQSAISQYEDPDGRVKPSPKKIARLSLALGVPPGFFTGEVGVRLDPNSCHFRKRRRARRKDQNRVLARADMVLILSDYLNKLMQLPDSALDEVKAKVKSKEDVEQLAQRVRDAWDLGQGPLPNIVRLLEGHGVFVLEAMTDTIDLDAFSTWRRGRPVVLLGSDKGSGSRRRFDAAHELGHLLMHPDCQPGDKEREREADRFAGAFLMPAESFTRECPSRLSWPHLRALKKRWGVSLQAIIYRAGELEVFTRYTVRKAHQQLRTRGWHINEPDEPPIEQPSLFARAIGLLSDQGFGLSRIADEARMGVDQIERLLLAPQRTPALTLDLQT
jgi:Zn-dependent peptidase ImmA (M78 family)/transcriptional regulator with XRE-family HTH domain